MSTADGQLCSSIIRDHFGPIVQQVAEVLVSRGRHTFLQLRKALPAVPPPQVHQALFVLMQHNVAKYAEQVEGSGSNSRVAIYYSVDMAAALLRLRLPLYVSLCRLLFGDAGAAVAQAVAQHGKAPRALLEGAAAAAGRPDAVSEMEAGGFLAVVRPGDSVCVDDKRLAYVREHLAAKAGATQQEKKKLVEAAALITEFDDDAATGAKRARGDAAAPGRNKRPRIDGEPLLLAFGDRAFQLYVRRALLLRLAGQQLGSTAEKLLEIVLEIAKSGATPEPVLVDSIVARFRQRHPDAALVIARAGGETERDARRVIDAHLATMSVEAFHQGDIPNALHEPITPPRPEQGEALLPVLSRGDAQRSYTVDMPRAIEHVKRRMIEAIIARTFGADALMVWRCLLMNGKLEEKGISRRCLLASASVRSNLFAMFRLSLVQTLDVPRAKDNTKNFYMWYVDLPLVVHETVDRLQTSASRLLMRLAAEQAQHRALIEKVHRDDVSGNLDLLPDFEQASWRRLVAAMELLSANLCKVDFELLILRDL